MGQESEGYIDSVHLILQFIMVSASKGLIDATCRMPVAPFTNMV